MPYDFDPAGYSHKLHLVCCQCGTGHAIEYAQHVEWPEFFDLFDLRLVEVPAGRRTRFLHYQIGRMDIEEARRALDSLPYYLAANIDGATAQRLKTEYEGLGVRVEVVHAACLQNPESPDIFPGCQGPFFGFAQTL